MKLRRIRAGFYIALLGDGEQRAIIRTEWDGPRGGTYYLWELASWDRSGWTIDGVLGHRTLREAREALS